MQVNPLTQVQVQVQAQVQVQRQRQRHSHSDSARPYRNLYCFQAKSLAAAGATALRIVNHSAEISWGCSNCCGHRDPPAPSQNSARHSAGIGTRSPAATSHTTTSASRSAPSLRDTGKNNHRPRHSAHGASAVSGFGRSRAVSDAGTPAGGADKHSYSHTRR
jgi:hypothetical protein